MTRPISGQMPYQGYGGKEQTPWKGGAQNTGYNQNTPQQQSGQAGSGIGKGYYNPYGYSQSAQKAQPSNPWSWGQKAVGMASEANEPIRSWQMDQMFGFQPQYGQGPQTGFQAQPFGQQAGQFMNQMMGYGAQPFGGDLMQQYGGGMGTVQPQQPQQPTGGRPPAGGGGLPSAPGPYSPPPGMGGQVGGGLPSAPGPYSPPPGMGGQVGGGLPSAPGPYSPPPGGGTIPSQSSRDLAMRQMAMQQGGEGGAIRSPADQLGQRMGGGEQWNQPVGYEGTPPFQQTPVNVPGSPQMDLQTLMGNRGAVEQARQTGLEQATGMATGGIPQEEIQRAIQLAQAPIQQAGQESMEREVGRLASAGWGGGGLADKARMQAMAQTQGQLGRTASDIALQGMGQSLQARQAGIGALGDIARGERGAEQAGLQALLGGGELAQRGALGAAGLGVEQQLGLGQLGLGGREAGIRQSLGQRGLDLQGQLQGGQLGLEQQRFGLESELGRREMGLAEQMQPGQLALQGELGRGQLGLGQYGAESQRMAGLLGNQLGGYQAQTDRMGTMGQLGLGAEQQAMNTMMQNRGYDIQEMMGQRGMDIQQQLGLGQQGYQYWQLPQQIQSQLGQTMMQGKYGQQQQEAGRPTWYENLAGGIGGGVGAGAGAGLAAWMASSKKFKKNVRKFDIEPDQILQLEPVKFDWEATGQEDEGLIAEDVDKVVPNLVVRDSNGEIFGVRYDKLAVYLLGVVKAQEERILALEGSNNAK